jgi:hypothetical protein
MRRNGGVDNSLLDTRAEGACASGQKFTEPVAFSSTIPTNLRLAPTALGNRFGLLTLRARCKKQPNGDPPRVQGKRGRASALCGDYQSRCAGRPRTAQPENGLPHEVGRIRTSGLIDMPYLRRGVCFERGALPDDPSRRVRRGLHRSQLARSGCAGAADANGVQAAAYLASRVGLPNGCAGPPLPCTDTARTP